MDMEQYSILARIGIVFKAKLTEPGGTVALKKVALRWLEDGILNPALREIKVLQKIEDNQYMAHSYRQRMFTCTSWALFVLRWHRAPELQHGARTCDEGVAFC